MSGLYLMTTVTDRDRVKAFASLYEECGIHVAFHAVGAGTAANEILDYFGLQQAEKTVMFSVVTDSAWHKAKYLLQKKLSIDVPGTGIAFVVPLSSIGGKMPLLCFTAGQDFAWEGESALKDTKYELLVVIANQGYTNLIMDAAREENAGGGTVIHARGTGMERAEQFLGVSLVNEKEMVFIVVKTEEKNRIMRAIMDRAGLKSKAQAITFSLPVTGTAGMRLLEQPPENED